MKGKVAIIGGGIAGSSVAAYLGRAGADVTLFEQRDSLVSGPPMCHLHAGGNLYREISDEQCAQLLRESVEFLRFYPHGVDFRPTVIAIPLEDPGSPDEVLGRLEFLVDEYAKLIKEDPRNEVLGSVGEYYRVYWHEELVSLKSKGPIKEPHTLDDWMQNAACVMDLQRLKYPVVIVQEYGLNMFRLGASAMLMLESMQNVHCNYATRVTEVNVTHEGFELTYLHNSQEQKEHFDALVNAAGFLSGVIDDMVGVHQERFVEFKAAYVTRWQHEEGKLPEIIFHGRRATPQGMAQFTPYPDNYFQLHGMTKEITLFDDGLVKSSKRSAQPRLHERFLKKIEQGWEERMVQERTQKAIEHMARFIPAFKDAQVAAKPLYGAQQIPGSDADLRAAEVSFELGGRYARCETVKASSVPAMADRIAKRFGALGILNVKDEKERFYWKLQRERVEELAKKLCAERGYPEAMAGVATPKELY